ncbi:MAG: ABC transporter substrate-binding protein [Fusobacteriaceae bacterium]
MRKKFLSSLILLGLLMVGCGKEAEKKEDGVEKKLSIAVISKGYQHEFWRAVELGAKQAGKDLNVDVSFIGPEKESEIGKQVGMVENAINAKVSGIVLAALDSNALTPVSKRAIEEKIPVVTFDSDLSDGVSSSFVATDNVAAGAQAALEMIKVIGEEGKVAIVAHNAGTTTALHREKGFREEMAKHSKIEILNTQFSDGDKSKALSITQDIVMANPDIKGVYGTNEGAAVGVARAIEEKGLQGKIAVIGFDSSEDEVRFINNGVMNGMMVQNPYQMGYKAVQTIVKVIKGEPVDKRIDTGAKFISKANINDEDSQKLIYPVGK